MVLNEVGQIAEDEWKKSAVIRTGIELDEFVIMPNHMQVCFGIGELSLCFWLIIL
jgi:REP element-mobilizing transposase RayT